jgi:hypothetical protein
MYQLSQIKTIECFESTLHGLTHTPVHLGLICKEWLRITSGDVGTGAMSLNHNQQLPLSCLSIVGIPGIRIKYLENISVK